MPLPNGKQTYLAHTSPLQKACIDKPLHLLFANSDSFVQHFNLCAGRVGGLGWHQHRTALLEIHKMD